jgi:DNA primase
MSEKNTGPAISHHKLESAPERPAARAVLIEITQAAARFFRARLPGSWAPAYLTRRGFSAAVLRQWQAGYAPAGWDTLTRHLRTLGYPAPLI